MKLYLTWLAGQLDDDRPSWRSDTVFLLDGAKYHTCKETQEHMKLLGIRVIFTGPYSYDAAPIELLFAYFKNSDINVASLPTGKK